MANATGCQLVTNKRARTELNNNIRVFPIEPLIVHVNFFGKDFLNYVIDVYYHWKIK